VPQPPDAPGGPDAPGLPVPPGLVARLRAAGCVFAEDEATLLAGAATGADGLERLVRRRVAGEPLEQVLGWVDFCGLRLLLEPGVFVPRRRTGLMVREALALVPHGRVPLLVDLCCGCGAVAAALAAAVPAAEVLAADIDPTAVHCARRNLPPDRVLEGDLFEPLPARLRGRVDVLTVNTPYVPTGAIASMPPEARDHEPALALDGGPDGLLVARRVAAEAGRWLAPGGSVVVETSGAQSPLLAEALTRGGLVPRVVTSADLDATMVVGVRIG
jgi:release factor glutamine methyltransferase